MQHSRKPIEPGQAKPARHADARAWTAVEKYKLRGLARKRLSGDKIARLLNRSVVSTLAMASKLGVPLDGLGETPAS